MKQELQRKTINQFPYGEAHMHIFMNGTDYKKAVADQKNGVCDRGIHAHLAEYRKRGITWLREGGGYLRNIKTDDGTGTCLWDHLPDTDLCHSQKGTLRSDRWKRLRNHAGVQGIDRGSAPTGPDTS